MGFAGWGLPDGVCRKGRGRTVAFRERVLVKEEGWDSLHEELLRLREWVAAEARARGNLARSADPEGLSSEYLQGEIVHLDRPVARLDEAAEATGPSGSEDQEAG
jgi:hypothetical protein